MYLFIFENESLAQSRNLQDGDLDACDSGVLTIVDISEFPPKVYSDGSWDTIDSTE